MQKPHQLAIEELKAQGIEIECNPLDEPPIQVGFPGVITDENRQKVREVLERHAGTSLEMVLGVSERQLQKLRSEALLSVMDMRSETPASLAEKSDALVRKQRDGIFGRGVPLPPERIQV